MNNLSKRILAYYHVDHLLTSLSRPFAYGDSAMKTNVTEYHTSLMHPVMVPLETFYSAMERPTASPCGHV